MRGQGLDIDIQQIYEDPKIFSGTPLMDEDPPRNLKRCIETIYRKLNLFRLMRAGENLFEDDLAIKVEFPMKITTEVVDKVIKINEEDNKTHVSMYM